MMNFENLTDPNTIPSSILAGKIAPGAASDYGYKQHPRTAINRKSKYPKPDLKLPITPYPEPKTYMKQGLTKSQKAS